MIPEITEGLEKESRYNSYLTLIKDVDPKVRSTRGHCPVHGEWWFERIGETNQFKCLHADHIGGARNPDIRPEAPVQR